MKKITCILAALASFGAAAPAMAGDTLVKVPAHSTYAFRIPADRDFHFRAEGIKDWVDLDYRLISPVGRALWEDLDSTAWTAANIRADTSGTYVLYIQNVTDEDTVVEISSVYTE
jgi:hypothetical protein